MAHTSETRSLFLRTLAEHPFIYLAAKKSGVAPATIYRWLKDNREFAKQVEKVKQKGLVVQNEKVESILVKKALQGDMGAIKFYLPHNDPKYRPMKSEIPPYPIDSEHVAMNTKVYTWITQNKPLHPQKMKEIMDVYRRFGYIDENNNFTEKFRNEFQYLTNNWEQLRKEISEEKRK